jgi:hypothetical protein
MDPATALRFIERVGVGLKKCRPAILLNQLFVRMTRRIEPQFQALRSP